MTDQEKDQTIAEQAAKIASLQNELASTQKVNEALTKQVEQGPTAKSATSPEGSFQYDGKTITFRFKKIVHNGFVITPAEILASEILQKELYEEKSGMLKY